MRLSPLYYSLILSQYKLSVNKNIKISFILTLKAPFIFLPLPFLVHITQILYRHTPYLLPKLILTRVNKRDIMEVRKKGLQIGGAQYPPVKSKQAEV